jgi:hypothetical protein
MAGTNGRIPATTIAMVQGEVQGEVVLRNGIHGLITLLGLSGGGGGRK